MSMDFQHWPPSLLVIQTAAPSYTKDSIALPQEIFSYYKVSWQKCNLSLMPWTGRTGRDIRAVVQDIRMLFRIFRVGKPTRQHMVRDQIE